MKTAVHAEQPTSGDFGRLFPHPLPGSVARRRRAVQGGMATPPLPAVSNPAGIGATVRITTCDSPPYRSLSICSPVVCVYRRSRDERIEGTVFTHDTVAGVVVIEQKGAGDKSTYRMLRSSAVKEVEVLAPPADERQWADSAEAELPVVDLDAVHARYERSIVKVEAAVERARRA